MESPCDAELLTDERQIRAEPEWRGLIRWKRGSDDMQRLSILDPYRPQSATREREYDSDRDHQTGREDHASNRMSTMWWTSHGVHAWRCKVSRVPAGTYILF